MVGLPSARVGALDIDHRDPMVIDQHLITVGAAVGETGCEHG